MPTAHTCSADVEYIPDPCNTTSAVSVVFYVLHTTVMLQLFFYVYQRMLPDLRLTLMTLWYVNSRLRLLKLPLWYLNVVCHTTDFVV